MQGVVKGRLSYDYNNKRYAITYNSPGISGFREVYDYAQSNAGRVHYTYCSSKCDAETLVSEQRRFHNVGGESPVQTGVSVDNGVTNVVCNRYTPTATPKGDVTQIYVAQTGGLPMRIVMGSVTYQLSGHTALVTSDFTIPSICPQRTCLSLLDVVFLLDQSGSVSSSEFEQLRSFTYAVTNAFKISPTGTKVGIRKFGATTSPSSVTPLSDCKSCVLSTINTMQSGFYGYTCIACGMEALMNEFRINGRTNSVTGKPVDRVSIVITDGDANQRTGETATLCNQAKSQAYLSSGGGQTVFVVGVGGTGEISEATLDLIASSKPGVTTKFRVTDYSSLSNVIDSITVATCLELTGTSCGTGCKGFCGCATCYCPECPSDGLACTTETCTTGQNGNGCQTKPRVCEDNLPCTQNRCLEPSGCDFSLPTVCNTTDRCFEYGCDPARGCKTPVRKNCDDGDPCTIDGCNAATGCTNTDVPEGATCTARCTGITCPHITCHINECDPSMNPGQCKARPRNCDDGKGCTINDRCENDACAYDLKVCDDSNKCTDDSCADPAGDCLFTEFNATERCDDHNVCTYDLCSATEGCYHTNMTCEPFSVCHTAGCSDLEGGCYSTFIVCDEVPEIKALLKGGCYVSACSTSSEATKQGCYLTKMENATVDDCGKCAGDGTACAFSGAGASTAALGGLALAAIVVLVIALAAAVAIVAGQKGYEVWAKGHQSLSGAQYNPGYDAGNLTGKNPLYDAGGATEMH